MTRKILDEHVRWRLLSNLRNARTVTDDLFQLVRPEALYDRPIPERHRIVFYLGHLEAFDWTPICAGPFAMHSSQNELDRLFAFGIDPTSGDPPDDKPSDWPREREILQYNRNVREAVDRCLNYASHDQLFWVAIEHRLMHAETLTYMLHWLPFEGKQAEIFSIDRQGDPVRSWQQDIPSGVATLGMPKAAVAFGWDNEFDAHQVDVPAFSIDMYKVTNAEYHEFVRVGGYDEPSFWSSDGWEWVTRTGTQHPKFWLRQGGRWFYRTMFADIPLPLSWPVYVSHAEAQAY